MTRRRLPPPVTLPCIHTVVNENADGLEIDDWNSGDSEENDIIEEKDNTEPVGPGEALEPYVGMEFESEDDARRFYNAYARRIGFVVRIMQRRRSEIDGRTLARRLGCNKQGFSPNLKGKIGPERKPRPSAREGCKATILFKLEKTGKWAVTRFVKDHNHPLVVNASDSEFTNVAVSNNHLFNHSLLKRDKDKKIQELARELQRQEGLCAAYRERLVNLLSNIESQSDHMSEKILAIVENVRKAEAEALDEALKIPGPTPE
ncbi:protein far1-related sequence 5 [Phtheirospermum japonicum]|uniref:Protein far1-related sequence 5 n=1 Tax=Phtheirospermum japonicum TaxID=374723 RepID=A0A830D3V7_9LAMI|nr:protein far1-related sequence 5 [Phtheirospermum japonicum]